ncbi:hypothetical protein KSP40_PGU009033 [Platanthera guangdongensis]|uniref:Uncharacterized protein n=1 Tax=Platanthera guangdongensis TaxID=2320717 RepID=A0ABR2M438_9ASPA
MAEKLGIHESKVTELASFLYKSYGTTFASFKTIGYSFTYDDLHSCVHCLMTI